MPTLNITFVAMESQELLWRYLFREFHWNQTCRRKLKGPSAAKQYMKPFPKIKVIEQKAFFFFFCLLVLNKWCYMLQISLWLVAVTEVEPKPQCMSVDTICILFIVNQFPQLLFSPGYNDVNLSTFFFFLKQQVRSLMLLNRTDGH